MLLWGKVRKFAYAIIATSVAALSIAAPPAQAATATINAVSFKAPVFDSYDHSTGGGVWNDGSVTYDKGELLGTNYKCGDIASFLLELNTSASATKQPAPYKAEIALTYTWDATGQSGTSLTPLTSSDHLRVNTGVIRNASGTIIGGATGTNPAGVPAGYDSGFNAAGLTASVATSPAPVVTGNSQANTNGEFTSGATKTVTFTVQGIAAGSNIVIRSDALIRCKPNATPTGNMQAALTYINVTYPGALEAVSAGNQTVNFRGVGNLAGLGSSLSITKSISTNGTDCTSTVSTRSFASPGPVRYCYTVTNTGNNDITNVQVKDDNATPGSTADDVVVSMFIRSNAQAATFTLSVADGVATGSYVHTYASAGTYTNIVTVTSSAATATASAIAIMGSTPAVGLQKVQTSGTPGAVGDVISYNLILTNNTGNNSPVDVVDSNASSLTCPSGTPVSFTPGTYGRTINNVSVGNTAGASVTCTATHIVSAADVTAGSVSNFFTGAKQGNTYTSNTVTTPIVLRPLTYSLDVVKTQSSTSRPKAVGDVITYNIQVTNTGTGALTNVSLADLLAGATLGTCSSLTTGTPPVTLPTSLAVGASFVCEASYTVASGDVTAGAVTNQARATFTGATTSTVDSNQVTTVIATTPSIQVIKIQATGSNANTGQYPSAVGQVLTYGISVINDGNVNLTGVIVTDANADAGSLICATAGATSSPGVSLAVGAVIECTASHTVTAVDLTAGSITNVASASGTGGSTPVSASSANVTTVAALKIEKSRTSVTNAQSGTYPTAGDVITYSIVVTNTGEVTLTNLVIADADASVTCNASQLLSLAPGSAVTCSATHTATLAEATAGWAYNTASVRTTQIATAINSNQVATQLQAPIIPHVSVVKARTGTAPSKEGDVVTYSITISSDGVGDASITGLTDANATIGTCTLNSSTITFASPVTLPSGSSIVCAATRTVTSVDIRAGAVTNTASVTATGTGGNSSMNLNTTSNTVSDPLVETKALTVVKSYNTAPSVAGDVVVYTIVTTNSGTVTLTNVSTTDTLLSSLTCSPTQPVASLTPGASFSCSGSYTVTAADVTAGHVINTASAAGTYNGNVSVSANSNTVNLPLTAPAPPAPPAPAPVAKLNVTKKLTATVAGKVGESISYEITVTNSGDVYLTGVGLTDANATLGTCSKVLPTPLAQGESFTCSAIHVITDADVLAGKVDNYAVANAANPGIAGSSNIVTVPLTAAPALSVTKALSGAAPSKVGDVISYTITATNSGNVTLTAVVVTDANAALGSCLPATPTTLAVGASTVCTATHVVTDADFGAGKVDNVAAATGKASAALPASANTSVAANSNLVTVPLLAAPALSIVKALNGPAPAKTGDTITYQIVVTNTGNVTLTDVVVSDANAAMGSCSPITPVTLAIGASTTCAATHVVTDADFAASKVDNVAAVKANSVAGSTSGTSGSTGTLSVNSNIVTVPLTANPALSISKKQVGGLPTAIGGYIHYSIVLTNVGNVNLHDVTISDDNAWITECTTANPAPFLAMGDSITCKAKHQLTEKDVLAGKVVNIASATSAENAVASSSSSGNTAAGSDNGASSGTGSTTDAPGSVVVPSNEVTTLIKIAGMPRIGKYVKPNGGTVLLGASALKNPKLTQLAFTGDLDNVVEDGGAFLALLTATAFAYIARRRLQRK